MSTKVLVVEKVDEELIISYSRLNLEDISFLIQYMVERVADYTNQSYNDVLNDFKEIGE